ncbi:MAG: hypothetical protein EBT67_00320 [Betaproteobacteria bacterium]|jgi:hypothetical protein|nr:hypothetical protein [Betaproteobacteria bacterium]
MSLFKSSWVSLTLLCAMGLPVHAAEMDNGERIFQASFGVITAFGLKKQMDADPGCQGKSYANFDLNQFLDAIPKDFLTKPNQRQGIEKQFLDYFQKLDEIQLPSGKNIASTYQEMKKSPTVVEYQQKESADTSAYCKKVYELTGDIFQRQIDSIKQLIVKK